MTTRPMDTPACETSTGAGPVAPWLTLVHGASQDRRVFSAQREAFAAHFRLLLVDLPGHGGSAAMAGPFDPQAHARAVLAALDGNGVASTHYWGTHTGAAVGLLLAVRHPERIASLVLEGAVIPGVAMPSVSHWFARACTIAREHGVEAARREWFEHAEWFRVIREHPDTCRAAAHRAMIDEFGARPWLDDRPPRPVTDVAAALGAVSAPVLLVNGEHDVADFLDTARRLARELPRAERAVIAGAGGFPLWEFPAEVNARVHAFLAARRP